MTRKDAFATYLELRESTSTGEVGAGLSHSAAGLVLLPVLEVAAHGEPRGIVTVLHDAGDHGARYEELAQALAELGWAVALPDLRGHGRSEGEKGHSNGIREVLRDLEEIENHLAYRLPEAPRVIVGQGLGALYALAYAVENPGQLSALVLAAPLFEPTFELPAPKKGLMGMLGKKVGPKSEGRIPWTSQDRLGNDSARAAWSADERAHEVITVAAAEHAAQAAKTYRARLAELRIPVLVLQGGADPITAPAVARSLAGPRIELAEFAGARHDVLHDAAAEATAALAAWLDRQVPK